MKKIDEVDPKIVEEFRQEWVEVGLCTKRANKRKAEAAITRVYVESEFEAPKFTWAHSPIDAVKKMAAREINKKKGKLTDSKSTGEWCGEYITPGSVPKSIIKELGLDSTKESEIKQELTKACNEFSSSCFYGQHEWWVPQYLFPKQHMDAECSQKTADIIDTWEIISRNCGWWAIFPGECICIEKPIIQKIDEEEVVHCEDGPAILFEDGFAVWMIHGIRLDEKAILRPQEQTIEEIHKEDNQDARSLRIERMGWPLYLQKSNSRVIDRRHNDIENTEECIMETPNGERRLVTTCPTGRIFALGIPGDVNDCYSAQAWLSNGKNPNRVIART